MNDQCKRFKLAELSPKNFKYLIFFQGLVTRIDAKIRRRGLSKRENEPNLKSQNLTEDGKDFKCSRRC